MEHFYREDPASATTHPSQPISTKFTGIIEVRPGYAVTMNDRGAVQAAIREKFGGRAFRLIMKKGKRANHHREVHQ